MPELTNAVQNKEESFIGSSFIFNKIDKTDCTNCEEYKECRGTTYTVRQLYNETDLILTKIEVLSMKQCMPSM